MGLLGDILGSILGEFFGNMNKSLNNINEYSQRYSDKSVDELKKIAKSKWSTTEQKYGAMKAYKDNYASDD